MAGDTVVARLSGGGCWGGIPLSSYFSKNFKNYVENFFKKISIKNYYSDIPKII
jgi:hypothetical protein